MLPGHCGLYAEYCQLNKIRLNEQPMCTMLQERLMRPRNVAIDAKVNRHDEMLAEYRFAMQLCGRSSSSMRRAMAIAGERVHSIIDLSRYPT
jgi:tRNA-dihydrouridine synthase